MQKFQNYLTFTILFLLPVYLIKIKFGWASFNVPELLIAALFLIWVFDKKRKYIIHNTSYIIPVSLIFTGLTFSVLANKNYYSGFGVIKGWFFFPIIFAIIFYDQLKKDKSLLEKSLIPIFLSGVLISVIGVVYEFLGIVTYDRRLAIFWDSPNQLAMFLATPLLIGIFFAKHTAYNLERSLNSTKLLLAFLGTVLIALDLYFTKSYGAWLGILAAIVVMLWLKYGKAWREKYFSIAVLIFIIIFGWVSLSKIKTIENLGERSSLASRVMIWKSASLMIKNNPLFGIGPGNFQEKYLEYQKYFPPYLEWSAPQPHNLYLAFWLESGLIGLIGFAWILYLFFRDNKKVYPFTKINKEHNEVSLKIKKQTSESLHDEKYFGEGAIQRTPNRDFGNLLLAIMVYTLTHGLADTTYWRNDLAVIFWIVIAANLFLARWENKAKS